MTPATPLAAAAERSAGDPRRWRWLPAVGSPGYWLLLGGLGMGLLGPLGAVTAAFMNFSIGFFVGGQVLAGILGSSVTYGYGREGRHGANYMQTTAASVAGMGGMGILVQAMVWLGMPQPPAWQLMLFLGAIAMFGAGVGMLYTPLLVDRLQLPFPSGLAVAHILRALTDPVLLRRSVARLGGGVAAGIALGLATFKVAAVAALEVSASTFGAGLVVGARITIPAVSAALLGQALVPSFVAAGWLGADEPFRKITFLIGLGLIFGAALVDVAAVLWRTGARVAALARGAAGVAVPAAAEGPAAWQRFSTPRLLAWVGAWGAVVVWTGSAVLQQPVGFLLFALGLAVVFTLVNGLSLGVCDSNPISSAFVVAVLLMAALGLRDPLVGLMAGAVLLVSTNVAGDMQQDRSTGWRLGTPRVIQFRFQVAGLVVGAVLSVLLAGLFMSAYPVLKADQTVMSAAEQPAQWSAAMTYKLVGALRSLTEDQPHQRHAIALGVLLGLVVQLARAALFGAPRWQRWRERSAGARAADFVADSVLLPSPYAFSFGFFLSLSTSAWFGLGGVVASVLQHGRTRSGTAGPGALPADMSTASLVGGGLIAGDALAALGLGLVGLAAVALG